jgi:hypothetical protein
MRVMAAANHQNAWTPANAVTGPGSERSSRKIAPKAAKADANKSAKYPNTRGSIEELIRTIPSGKNRVGAAAIK